MDNFRLKSVNKLLIAVILMAMLLVWLASRGESFEVHRPRRERGFNSSTTLTAVVPN